MSLTSKRRILITGAAGNLGRRLRIHWWDRDDLEVVLLDREAGGDSAIVIADLAQWDDSWADCFRGIDTVVHLAAKADATADHAELEGANIVAVCNLYRAASLHGVARVILASSVWAMAGRANDSAEIFADKAIPGDNAYGASKSFAENLAREQALRGGPSTIAIRIGGCPPGINPPIRKNDWEDQCWLSSRDFCRGIDCALAACVEEFVVVNLTSSIPNGRWDLEHTQITIGYVPQDRFDPPPVAAPVGSLRQALRKVRRTLVAKRFRRSEVGVVSTVRCELGEGALWDPERQCVWFLDIAKGKLHRFHPESGTTISFPVPGEPAFVAHDSTGGLVLGSGSTIFRFNGDILEPLAKIHLPPDARVNDCSVDNDGMLWFGSMDSEGIEPSGRLYRHELGEMRRHGRPCPIVNGPAFSPDGSILYQVDTVAGIVWKFAMHDGLPEEEGEQFIIIDRQHGSPDGITIDEEGALWVALWGGWAARRYASDGKLLATIRFPCANVTKIALGGPNLTTAYATSAAIGLSPQERRAQALAGAVFRFEVEVPGVMPVPRQA